MEICDPEVVKTERFGSRDDFKLKESVCLFCGAEILDKFFCDISGNLFCSRICRDKRDIKGKEKRDDKKRTYAAILLKQRNCE